MIMAEKMLQRALSGKQKLYGPEHTSTLNTVKNLGRLYAIQGRMTEAETMYLRAFNGLSTLMGPNHPLTTQSLCDLISLRQSIIMTDEQD